MRVSIHKLAHRYHTVHGTGDEYVTAAGYSGGYYGSAGLPFLASCDRCGANCSPNGAHYEPNGIVVCGFCAQHDWASVAAAAADLADWVRAMTVPRRRRDTLD